MSKTRKPNRQSHRRQQPRPQPAVRAYEAEVAEGLEDICRQELAVKAGNRLELPHPASPHAEPGIIRFGWSGGLRALLHLNTIQAIYLSRLFEAPRPRALLGDENLRLLLDDIASIRQAHPPGSFQTFYVSAAGGDTAVLQRLKAALAEHTGLKEGIEEGDLLIRLRRPPGGEDGWETLLRISPRPLATRPWRVCNMEGALNATVAHAMALMTDPRPYDMFLNIACGSGTLLIERLACAPARRAIGCDTSSDALDCARRNIEAAGYHAAVELHAWDARQMPLADGSIDALCADLPFGHLVGSHDENIALYPAIMQEAARVARPGALFVLITHEVRLVQTLLEGFTAWQMIAEQRVALGGLYPRIFVLRRGI